jgi:hypothetical protein
MDLGLMTTPKGKRPLMLDPKILGLFSEASSLGVCLIQGWLGSNPSFFGGLRGLEQNLAIRACEKRLECELGVINNETELF